MSIREAINTYGRIAPEEPSIAAVSIANYRDKYMRQMLMTSLVGFLWKNVDGHVAYEQVSDNDPRIAGLEGAARETAKTELLDAANDAVRKIIKTYLKRQFNYNPDYHVSAAPTENPDDPERKPTAEVLRERMSTAAKAPALRAQLQTTEKIVTPTIDEKVRVIYETARKAQKVTADLINTLNAPHIDSRAESADESKLTFEDRLGLLAKYRDELDEISKFVGDYTKPLSAEDTLGTLEFTPSRDIFHHWMRYHNNNFEAIEEATHALYLEKPDIEFIVQYYNHFEGENRQELARDFCKKYENSFFYDVYSIETGAWSILGPYKRNRERVDFYNKNTEVIKKMLDAMQADQKLGEDMMKKTVRKQKARNQRAVGPDDPNLEKYREAMGAVETLSAKEQREALTEAERDRLNAAQRYVEQEEVPEDGIQVDVFVNDPHKKTFERKIMYTKAEAPKTQEELRREAFVEEYKQSLLKTPELAETLLPPSAAALRKDKK